MNDCIFCKIVKGEVPSKKVFEDELILAFHDINPKAPVHVLVIPKKHISSLIDINNNDKELMGNFLVKASAVAGKLGLNDKGYKIVVNNGNGAGQLVFHLHMHILGGWEEAASGWQI